MVARSVPRRWKGDQQGSQKLFVEPVEQLCVAMCVCFLCRVSKHAMKRQVGEQAQPRSTNPIKGCFDPTLVFHGLHPYNQPADCVHSSIHAPNGMHVPHSTTLVSTPHRLPFSLTGPNPSSPQTKQIHPVCPFHPSNPPRPFLYPIPVTIPVTIRSNLI
jgi:hypothetical protein